MDIKLISTEELKKDRDESFKDIIDCKNALAWGVYKYSGGNVTDRIEVNQKIIIKIEEELKLREQEMENINKGE